MKKSTIIISASVLFVLGVLLVLPVFAGNASLFAYAVIAVSLFLGASATTASEDAEMVQVSEPEPKTVPETEQPKVAEIPQQSSEVQVAQLLGLLQEKGRFLDFVMDDVKSYSDAQIAAAARFVHQGCHGVVKGHFSIEPISAEPENQPITLSADYQRTEYRLSGKIKGEPPFSGVLKHKGWKTTSVSLPKVMGDRALAKGEHVLAPAEVEVS